MMEANTINESSIEAWAKSNIERAKVLGWRLIQHQTPEALEALESLGDDEDLIEAWAIKNPMRARLLVLRLLPLFSGS